MRKMKKGVSLVTVLLFMMVATIAATATYKWLSSVGMSSAARLQLNEARQSALSGIEAARSWMTYNGNDLGAVIKQYFDEGKKPILLNSVLPSVRSGKTSDSVWLMGVNIESSSKYKVKIVSLGTTRENVKYSEVAIFNVGGLYQAEIPSEAHNVAYKDAFHGSLTTAGAINVTSAFIKQSPAIKNSKGQALNSISASEYLVLDGNFYVNNGGSIKDLYVTGDLSFLKNLTIRRNLYVGGKVYGTSTASQMNVYGSSYLNGGMKVNDRSDDVKNNGLYSPSEVTGGKFDFYGNVTSNGDIDHFKAEASASYINMHRNLVLNGKLNFPTSASSNDYYFHVDSNAFIKENSTATGNIGANYIGKTLFGNNIDDTLCLAQFDYYNGANDCGSLYNFCAKSKNGNIYIAYNGRLMSALEPSQYQDWNADSMVTYRDMITDESEKIDCGTSRIAKDKLSFNTDLLSLMTTGGVSYVHTVNAKNGCGSEIWDDKIEAPVNALNTCYNIANNADMLYDKIWLIVSWDHAPVWSPTNEKLNGNFIFVINSTSNPTKDLELPETTGDAKVLVYLPNGWKNKSLKTKDNSNARSNYFVYSVDDIGGFMMQNSPLNGSVYMQGCSQLNTLGDNNTLNVTFNEPLFKGLVKSSILCDYNVSGTCRSFTGSVSGFDGYGIDPYQTEDSYHIATSPQLIVEMESQYRNKEPLPKTTGDYGTVTSSEVVLPRIIYLPRDARGRFSDYYNVVGLNGNLKASKDPFKMQCSGIPTGDQMLTSSGDLAEGKYLCAYGNNEKPIPVFVVVEGSLSENSSVHFHDDDIEKKIGPGGHTVVRLVATESDVPMTVTISFSPADGWDVEPAEAFVVYNPESSPNTKVYTVTTTASGINNPIPVFNVKSDLQSDAAGVYFHITGCEKCIVGDENKRTAHVFTKNVATLVREDVNCREIDENEFEQKYGIKCSELVREPSCGGLVDESKTTWVTARGFGCVPMTRNEKWECRTGGNEVHLESVLSADNLCTAYVPTKSIQLKSPDGEYKLPAELKRKRNTLFLKREGVRKGTINVKHQELGKGSDIPNNFDCSEDLCVYNFYAGDTVYFSRGSGDFSYWTCNGKSCGDYKPDDKISDRPFRMLLLGGVDTVTAWFGQKDAHCFYTNFQDVKSSVSNSDDGWCIASDIEDNKECIDKCKNDATHCSVGQNPYEGQFDGSDWLVVYSNDDNGGFKFPQIDNREGKIKHPEGFGRRVFLKTKTGKPTVMLNRVDAGPNGLMTAMLNIPSGLAQIITEWEKLLQDLREKRPSMDKWWVPKFIRDGIDDAIETIEKGLKIGEALLINDGLIIRSNANATEYFTLNVVAKEPTAYARLCYVNGQENDINRCHDVRFNQGPNDSWIATASRLSRLNLNVDVNGSVIRAVLSKNYLWDSEESTMAVATFDLNDETIRNKFNNKTLEDKVHNYVGLKFEIPYVFKLPDGLEKIINGINDLADFFGSSLRLPTGYVFTSFEVFDIGWRSYDYDADCWDTPKVSCSFKTNYIGGMVPYNADVTPWVGRSSWFEDKSCEVFYYYNGCDVSPDKFEYGKSIPRGQTYHQILQSVGYWDLFHNLGDEIACASDGKSGKGLYNFSSRKLRDYGNLGALNSNKYLFETEGYHGYPIQTSKTSGYVNEASIIVVCKRDEDNNNSHVYDASCGDFIVGEYEQCSESFTEMLSQKSNGYCYAGVDSVVTLDKVYNVRDAVVSFTLTEPTTSEIKAYLVDEDENISALDVDQVGDLKYSIDVASVSDKHGFNPQKLHAILFKDVSSSFAVDHVESSCRHEFHITCNDASYSFSDSSWTVSADIVNPERAKGGCDMVLVADGYEVSGTRVSKPCSESFVQDFKHEVYGQSLAHTYAFKIAARDEKGDVLGECTTDPAEYEPLEIQCYVNNSVDLQYVPQGTGVPQFSFSVANCPPEGCPYTLRYPSKFGLNPVNGVIISNAGLTQMHPSVSINTPENKLSKDVYEYQLDVMGHSCPSGYKFEVVGEPEKGTCSNPRIVTEEDGKYFKADVTFGDGGYWNGTILDSVKVVYTDPLGNVISVNSQQVGTPQTYEYQREVTVSHKLPAGMSECSQGVCNYIVVFKIYGDGDEECSHLWTARKITSMNTSGCLAAPITNQDPSNVVSFTPVIGGCEDGNCNWTISTSGGKELDRGSGYNGHSTLSFSDSGAAGTRLYNFHVFAQDQDASYTGGCDFSVTYKPEATEISYCGFGSTTTWGGEATLSFTTNCADCQYTIKSALGNLVSSGKTDPTGNSSIDVSFNIYKDEPYEVAINGKTCEAKPFFSYDNIVECSFVDDQGSTIDEIASNKTAQFKVRFNKCHNGSCQWNANLKHNAGNTIGNAGSLSGWPHIITSSNDLFVDIPGSGTYTLEFNDHVVCSKTLNEKAYLGDVGSCSFNKAEYAYGETGIKFKVNGLTAENERWIITNSAGTIITEGNSGMYNNSNLTINMPPSFIANNENKGTYEFRLTEGDVSCPVNPELKVKTPRVSCDRQCNKALIGSKCSLIPNYRLQIDVTNCANCSYVVKEGSNFVTSGNISTSTTISKNISDKNYTVYLNGTSSGIQCNNVVVK